MIRAAIFRAVSSKPQAREEKISLELQLSTCEARLKDIGATLMEVLTVPGHSRDYDLFEEAIKEMPAYARLKELVDKREIDLLIFYNKSRLARDLGLGAGIISYCQRRGCAIYDVSAPPSTLDPRKQRRTTGDILTSAFTGAIAQNDNAQRAAAQENGMINRVKKGKMPAKPPFGYRKTYKEDGTYTIVIDEVAAETVRMAFDEYLKGRGVEQVAEILKDRGRSTPANGKWCKGTLKNIFERVRIYAGRTEVNRNSEHREFTSADGDHPPIISKETALRFKNEKAERVKARRATGAGSYLYSRLITCGICGHLMRCDGSTRTITSKRTGKATIHQNIRCRDCKRSIAFNVLRPKIEQEFTRISEQFASQEGELIAIAAASESAAIEKQLAALESEIKSTKIAQERANRAYTDGIMDYDAYKAQVKRLKSQAADQERQVHTLESRLMAVNTRAARSAEVVKLSALAIEMLSHADVQAANAWLREFWIITLQEDGEIEIMSR